MKKSFLIVAMAIAVAGAVRASNGDDGDRDHFEFVPGTLVLARSVYVGTADLLVPGVTVLPPGCVAGNPQVPLIAGGSVSVAVTCSTPTNDGSYPGVFFNSAADSHFGITSPIFLDNLNTEGHRLGTLAIPTDTIVTSFSSKSELSIHRSSDGKSLTFVAYHGGLGFPTGPNIFDVSNGNTPGLIDPTNAAVSQYYRSVLEVDAHGHMMITDGNAYSGDNGRGAFKGENGLFYMVGNDNSGNLSKTQVTTTIVGEELVKSTGVELLYPGQSPPPLPPNINKIGDFEINQVTDPVTGKPYKKDKAGKDNNYRGITIYNNTLYVTKGSGGNGINTVYQVGTAGTLPTGDTATLAKVPIAILPGFPSTLASGMDSNGNPTPVSYPFGIWFANANTLYVCDEGDGNLVPPLNGNVATPDAQAHAGIQKWILNGNTWQLAYILNDGLNIGIPYGVANYPADLNPATGGCRSITGRLRGDGKVELFATTSTISPSGDQGADPNLLVRVKDVVGATTAPGGSGDQDGDDPIGHFRVIRAAKSGEVFRGVDFAPQDHN